MCLMQLLSWFRAYRLDTVFTTKTTTLHKLLNAGLTFTKPAAMTLFPSFPKSYRHYPVNLDVISWLGVWYVKSELYEKAIHYFETAAQIQPTEVRRCNPSDCKIIRYMQTRVGTRRFSNQGGESTKMLTFQSVVLLARTITCYNRSSILL